MKRKFYLLDNLLFDRTKGMAKDEDIVHAADNLATHAALIAAEFGPKPADSDPTGEMQNG